MLRTVCTHLIGGKDDALGVDVVYGCGEDVLQAGRKASEGIIIALEAGIRGTVMRKVYGGGGGGALPMDENDQKQVGWGNVGGWSMTTVGRGLGRAFRRRQIAAHAMRGTC